jgi:hypothetical protein
MAVLNIPRRAWEISFRLAEEDVSWPFCRVTWFFASGMVAIV